MPDLEPCEASSCKTTPARLGEGFDPGNCNQTAALERAESSGVGHDHGCCSTHLVQPAGPAVLTSSLLPNPLPLGDISAENLREEAMELSLLIRGSWKNIRFNIVPVVRRQQEPLQLQRRQSDRGFPEGSLRKATEEAHFVPASPQCWR